MSADVVTRTVRLGARFADETTGAPVAEGLVVTVRGGRRTATALRTPSGTFAVHDHPAPTLEVSAYDTAQRFLPTRFTVTDGPGTLVTDPCATGAKAIPLASSPGRPTPPGYAAIRAQLHDLDRHRPAAWATLTVAAGATSATGVAAPNGDVLVLLPWPALATGLNGTTPLAGQHWTLTLTARNAGADPDTIPDLCALHAQPVAHLLADDDPRTPLPAPTLSYGAELVVRSTGRSELLLTSTATP